MEIITWLQTNWSNILEVIGAVVTCATVIVKIFGNEKSKSSLQQVIKVLSALSLVNQDGTFIGKDKKQEENDTACICNNIYSPYFLCY